MATLVTRRHVLELRDDDGRVEVADDLVTSTVDGRAGPSFRQVEVETEVL